METLNGFFISVIKEESTSSRLYSDFVRICLELASNEIQVDNIEYHIRRHDSSKEQNIQLSIFENIIAKNDFFVCLIDYFVQGKQRYEPNVWFELGLAASTEKPIFLIARHDTKIPYDVELVNTIKIRQVLYDSIMELQNRASSISEDDILHLIKTWRSTDNSNKELNKSINGFIADLSQALIPVAENRFSPFQSLYELAVLKKEKDYCCFSQLLSEVIANREQLPRFIPGEKEAFEELTKSIIAVKQSILTSRFGKHSIVTNPDEWHTNFTTALYEVSKKDCVTECDRIICNNSPQKWKDVFSALINGGNNMFVYVRAENFNPHFELVVIDDSTGFIHFYDKFYENEDTHVDAVKPQTDIQRINSTLVLKGSDVCKRLIGIFKRCHHKSATQFSHTILGVDNSSDSVCDYRGRIGVFNLAGEYDNTYQAQTRKRLDTWKLLQETYESCMDKVKSDGFIHSFTLRDAWIMFIGLSEIAIENAWELKIISPAQECPSDLQKYMSDFSVEHDGIVSLRI